MRTSGILIMAGGLALGVGLAIFLASPGPARSKPPEETGGPGAERPATQDFPEVSGQKAEVKGQKSETSSQKTEVSAQPKPRPVPAEAAPVVPPADGQKIELANGIVVRWARGVNQLSGWRQEKRVWAHELAFPVADVIRWDAPNELRIASVDALSSVIMDGTTGMVMSLTKLNPQGGEEAVAGLLAEVKTLHADGLAKMRAGDGKGTLAACQKMGELANRLAEAKHQTEAFRIWAAAKKLRRAVAPELIGKEIPKEQQPGPEDLEF